MATFSTPAKPPQGASVTPHGTTDESPVPSRRFDAEVLDFIVGLLEPDTAAADLIRDTVDALFTGHWRVREWSDLMVFNSTDVTTTLTSRDGLPEEITSPVIVKRLGYIVDFARVGVLTDQTTMNDVVRGVTMINHPAQARSVPNSPNHHLVQVFDKKAVPTLEKFNGHDEDYFNWKESTINALGTAGFSQFLDNTEVVIRHPEVAVSVFYSLQGAVHGGQAQSIAQQMLDDKNLDPAVLWSALETYYDTALNRANVVLFDTRRLFHLRLDPDNSASKFISDYKDCLQRLRKHNARIAEDNDSLRALLLVAIQDDDFEMVRDSIVHKPNLSVDSILTELREREMSLVMKDRASDPSKDGSLSSRYSRRVNQSLGPSSRSFTPKDSSTASTAAKKWSIPRYPDSWKKAFGNSLFKLLLDWRTDAHKGSTQQQLNSSYDTVVEFVSPSKQGNSKAKSGQASGGGAGSSTNSGADSISSDSKEPPRKRIRLQKSRRVVTECSA